MERVGADAGTGLAAKAISLGAGLLGVTVTPAAAKAAVVLGGAYLLDRIDRVGAFQREFFALVDDEVVMATGRLDDARDGQRETVRRRLLDGLRDALNAADDRAVPAIGRLARLACEERIEPALFRGLGRLLLDVRGSEWEALTVLSDLVADCVEVRRGGKLGSVRFEVSPDYTGEFRVIQAIPLPDGPLPGGNTRAAPPHEGLAGLIGLLEQQRLLRPHKHEDDELRKPNAYRHRLLAPEAAILLVKVIPRR